MIRFGPWEHPRSRSTAAKRRIWQPAIDLGPPPEHVLTQNPGVCYPYAGSLSCARTHKEDRVSTTTRGLRAQSVLLVAVLSFSACATGSGDVVLSDRFDSFGARELVANLQKFEGIDLASLLSGGTSTDATKGEPDIAFKAFNGDPARRNAIQERILGASDERCGAYKKFLKQYEGQAGFAFGAVTTILAAAGALFSPVAVARALSGSAAAVSGVHAEFTEKFFARLTIQVLTKGIDARRKNLYAEIRERRSKDGKDVELVSLSTYSVEAAIKDALTYHAACSLIAGLEEAAASIERADNPGIDQLGKFSKKLKDAGLPGLQFGTQNQQNPTATQTPAPATTTTPAQGTGPTSPK